MKPNPWKTRTLRSRWAPGAETLAGAARAVAKISFNGRTADDALAPSDTAADRAAVRAITLGTVRWYIRLTAVLDHLLETPRPADLAETILLVVDDETAESSLLDRFRDTAFALHVVSRQRLAQQFHIQAAPLSKR